MTEPIEVFSSPLQKPAQVRRPALGYSVYLGVVLLFSVNGTVSKSIMASGLSPERLSQFRATASFLVLLAVVLIMRPRAMRTTKREFALLAAYGVLGVTMTQYLYFIAISRLPVGVGLLLEFTAPIMIALWLRFVVRQHVRPQLWLGLALALGGLAVVAQVWHGLTLDGLGVIAGLGAAAALALYYLVGERAASNRDPLTLTTWSFGFATAFWALLQPWTSFPWSALDGSTIIPTSAGNLTVPVVGLAAYMVLLGTVVTFAFVNFSLRHLTASQASVVGMTEPLMASAVAWLALGERLSAIQILGGAVVLVGILLAEFSRYRAA
ncbi:MAG: EamA family transporter [Actinobacteria bacterium]|nr:EamA family transporter [Actinomycetota bacterium]